MREVVFAIPGDIGTATGGYVYDREVLARFSAYDISARHVALPASFPSPTPADLAETERLLASTPADAVLLIDGLAFGVFPSDMVERLGRPVVALVHHPLGYESGLTEKRARDLIAAERAALATTRRIITTSRATARLLFDEFGVPPSRVTVAEPGTEPAPRAEGTGEPVMLLAVGAVSPRKGYTILIEALSSLTGETWHLTIAGDMERNPEATAALKRAVRDHRLEDRVRLVGSLPRSDLEALFAAADIFVMPSLFEGYGMVLGEAMARGLPIICTTGGAAAETVPDSAGIKVPPGDAAAFSGALRDLLVNVPLRQRLAEESWRAGLALPRWDDTARRIANVLKEVDR